MNIKCYISNDILTEENSSVEHIIPNALGGKLKSRKLLCEKWNVELGRTIDDTLSKSIIIPSLLDIKRERGKNPQLHGKDASGIKYHFIDKKTAKQAPRKPRRFKNENGEDVIEFLADQANEVLNAVLKKNPNKSMDELNKNIEYRPTNSENIVYFDNHFSVLSGYDNYRAIVKIATNFYVYKRQDSLFCQSAINFVKGEDGSKGVVQYYYTDDNVGNLANDEFSHIIYLKGDYSEKLLFCYIELFNVHNFIVVLNKEYDGPNFEETYIFDLDKQKKLERKIHLNIARNEILNLPCPGPKNVEDLYFIRLQRLAQIKGFKIARTNISK
jgi:hypothetical protein